MNDASGTLNEFIKSIGMLTEVWVIIYNGFKRQGMHDSDALKHTEAFMSAAMNTIFKSPNKENSNDQS